jgi:hypothetical protein
MRSARGQGTIEYLGVVLLVAVVAGAGTALAAGGPSGDIASAVTRQFMRALCLVTGGDCDRDRAPCDVGTRTEGREWTVTVLVVKGGHRRAIVRQQRSDGTVLITEVKAPLAGIEATNGVRARIKLGDGGFAFGSDVTAAVTAEWGDARTWRLPNAHAADALVAALEDGTRVRPADEEVDHVSAEAGVSGTAPLGQVARGSAAASMHIGGARRTDRVTGNRTYYLDLGVAGQADASGRASIGKASVAGADSERFALTVARDGRWLDLARIQVGELSGAASLPTDLVPVIDSLDVPTQGHRRWVAETHLDLSDAENLAVAEAVVAQTRSKNPLGVAKALNALSLRLSRHGVVDARTYAVDTDTTAFEAHGGRGFKVGGKYETTTEKTRLIAARTRGIDGRWRHRDDCLKEVGTA